MRSADDIILIKGYMGLLLYIWMVAVWYSGLCAAQQSFKRMALKSNATASNTVVKTQIWVAIPTTVTVSQPKVLKVWSRSVLKKALNLRFCETISLVSLSNSSITVAPSVPLIECGFIFP